MSYCIQATRHNGLIENCFESNTESEMIEKMRYYCFNVSESEACLNLLKQEEEGFHVTDIQVYYAVFEDYKSARHLNKTI